MEEGRRKCGGGEGCGPGFLHSRLQLMGQGSVRTSEEICGLLLRQLAYVSTRARTHSFAHPTKPQVQSPCHPPCSLSSPGRLASHLMPDWDRTGWRM